MPSPRPAARRALAVALALVALLAPASAALAQCPRTTLADLEDEVMCPQCGVPLALATDAPQAKAEREFIRRLVDECRSKEEIKDALRAEFGDAALAVPEPEGFDLAAYLVPLLALVLGGAGAAVAAVRWRRSRVAAAGAGGDGAEPDGPAPADAARLDEELRRFDG
jgi:cytochrome c-type biogenesis protein CcmH